MLLSFQSVPTYHANFLWWFWICPLLCLLLTNQPRPCFLFFPLEGGCFSFVCFPINYIIDLASGNSSEYIVNESERKLVNTVLKVEALQMERPDFIPCLYHFLLWQTGSRTFLSLVFSSKKWGMMNVSFFCSYFPSQRLWIVCYNHCNDFVESWVL